MAKVSSDNGSSRKKMWCKGIGTCCCETAADCFLFDENLNARFSEVDTTAKIPCLEDIAKDTLAAVHIAQQAGLPEIDAIIEGFKKLTKQNNY